MLYSILTVYRNIIILFSEAGAVFTFGKSKFGNNAPNKFWIRSDKVTYVCCGDEHTAIVAGMFTNHFLLGLAVVIVTVTVIN